jgi:CHASE3 domain sensor protein
MKLNKRFVFLLIFTPTLLLIIAATSWLVYKQSQRLSDDIDAHSLTQKYLRTLLVELLNAETGQRGFLLTEKDVFLQPYYLALQDIKVMEKEFSEVEELHVLPKEQHLRLERLAAERLAIIEQTLTLYRLGSKQEAIDIIKRERGKIIMDSIRHIIEPNIVSLDKQLLKQQAQLSKYSLTILALIFLAFAVVLVVCFLFYQSVADEVENRDALNKALEEKNKQLKDFTYQSYHQLKTPLRSIAGFLQLLEKKADNKLDSDAKEMIAFSVDACEKMNEQIDEIRALYLK